MAAVYTLRVVGRDRTFFEGEVVSAVIPGGRGAFGVLAGHAPLVSTVEPGLLTIRDAQGASRRWRVGAGLAEVLKHQITLFLDTPPVEADSAKFA